MAAGTFVLIMQPLPASSIAFLREQGAEPLLAYESDDWRSVAAEIRALIYNSIPIDKSLLDELPALEIIGKRGVGVDTVDITETRRRGIRITNVGENGNAESVSEHAVALLLAAERSIVSRDALTRQGRFAERFALPLVHEITGSRLGLVGAGRIGRRVGHTFAAGFGCEVGAYDPFLNGEVFASHGLRRFDDLQDLFAWADNAVIAAPLTPQSRGMIGLDELRALGPKGVLVVISRGGIVDEAALAETLRSRAILAAGLDVYDGEPRPPAAGHPLFGLDNVVLTPHVAGATVESRERSSLTVCRQVWSLLGGGQAPLVDQRWLA